MKKFFLTIGFSFLFSGAAYCPAEEFQTELTGPATALVLAKNDESGDHRNKNNLKDYLDEYDEYDDESHEGIADPFETMNRFFFHFNDKLYFFVLKPVASGYRSVLPAPVRISIGNFFKNITYPIRFVSCLSQGKIEGAFVETGRFLTNSTVGLAGLFDPATELLELKKYDEDLGQTLGSWGMGHGFFLTFPFLGPSSLRDGIGTVGDNYLDPLNYIFPDFWDRVALFSGETVNSTSFRIGDYESLKEAAIDPYIALRDAYVQSRARKVAE